MNTLIVYASRNGFTQKIVELLSDQLKGNVSAQICDRDYTVDLTRYDNIIVGSPIYYGRMNNSVLDFCMKYQELLKSKRFSIFAVGADGASALDVVKNALPDDLVAHAGLKAYFGYGYDFDRMGFLERFIIRHLAKQGHSETRIEESSLDAFVQDFNAGR